MATVNFYLKEPEATGETLIYLFYHCEAFRLKISTGEKIDPSKWNENTHRAKKSLEGFSDFNNFLNRLEAETKRISREILSSGRLLTSDELKESLKLSLGKQRKVTEITVYEAFNQFFEYKKGKLSENYLKSMTTLKNHLKTFETAKRYKITFERLNLAFYELFTSYLMNDCGQTNNTIGTNISRLKYFLKWSEKMGYNKFTDYKESEFKAIESETEMTYLTEEELFKLYELPLTKNSRLYNVRESFCFGCFTGLRFSDIAKIREDDIRDDELILTIQKTRENVTIPLNDFAKDILERNSFRLPVISNQKSNDYIKELCEKAKINEKIKITRFKGAERIEVVESKFKLITTHTARRTFVTISLEKGMRPEMVMAITGHKSYKNFKKYIKLTDKVKKIELKRIWNKPLSNILQVI